MTTRDVHFEVDQVVWEQVEALARDTGKEPSQIMLSALLSHLREQREALDRRKTVEPGGDVDEVEMRRFFI